MRDWKHLFKILISFLSKIYPERLLDHIIILLSIFWWKFILFSIVVVLVGLHSRQHQQCRRISFHSHPCQHLSSKSNGVIFPRILFLNNPVFNIFPSSSIDTTIDRKLVNVITLGPQPCLTQWNQAMPMRPPKTGGSWWRGLTECGPLEKGMANHFSILTLRTPWTVWKGKMIGYWKRNSPGQ